MSLEKTKNSRDFIFGRFSRLYPAYWAAVILTSATATVAAASGFSSMSLSGIDVLINLSMFQHFFNVPHVDGVYWTLELELSFYIIMLTLYRIKALKQINTVALGWLLIILVVFLLQKKEILFLDQRIRTFLLIDYAPLFIIGIFLYKTYSKGFSVKSYAIIVTCLLFNLFKHGWESTVVVTLVITIFDLIMRGYLTFINLRPLLFLGTISYSLYLIHENIGYTVIKTLEKFGFNLNIGILLALILSILLASAITFLIERPAMRFMKEKYNTFRSRKPN